MSLKEGSMSKFATRLLMLTIYTVSLALVPIVTPAKAETSHSKHVKKHNKRIHRNPGLDNPGFGNPWSAGRAWPDNRGWGSSNQPSKTCFRAFECAKWPPPFDEDPDRKASGTDQ
jgi:hypothetical protein